MMPDLKLYEPPAGYEKEPETDSTPRVSVVGLLVLFTIASSITATLLSLADQYLQ